MTTMPPTLVLGIDGGGTSTKVAVLELHTENVRGAATAGSSNRNSVGWTAALQNLRQAADDALAAAAAGWQNVAAVCACMSGVDRPEDEEGLAAELQHWVPAGSAVWVHNDAVAALCAGTGGRLEGAVIIAGTGTIAFGCHRGATARAAGWGGAFLDGGSGFDLGQRALAAAVRAADGRGPPTALLAAVCEACGVAVQQPEGLLGWAYGEAAQSDWARTAALATCVTDCAAAGDRVASSLLDAAAAELAGSLQAVCRRLGLGQEDVGAQGAREQQHAGTAAALPDRQGCSEASEAVAASSQVATFSVVLAGGLLSPGSLYARRVEKLIQQQLPAAQVLFPACTAEEGAALLGRSKLLQGQQQLQ